MKFSVLSLVNPLSGWLVSDIRLRIKFYYLLELVSRNTLVNKYETFNNGIF